MTLDEFIARSHPDTQAGRVRNAHVTAPGFSELYVRRSTRHFQWDKYPDVLDLASVAAQHPGEGAFKKLIATLTEKYPNLSLYVESVLSPRFQAGLLRLGFQAVEDGSGFESRNFFLPAAQPVGVVRRKQGDLHGQLPTP